MRMGLRIPRGSNMKGTRNGYDKTAARKTTHDPR